MLNLHKMIFNNVPFALIRLPKEDRVYLVSKEDEGENVYIFNSFDGEKKYQFQFTEFKEIDLANEMKLDNHFPLVLREEKTNISKQEYVNLLNKTISFLRGTEVNKIVISRSKWMEEKEINPINSFLYLCKKYPLSFCHLSFWNKEEVWLGATPEVLGTYINNEFETMSLAGTLPDDDSEWRKKEIEEQHIVTQYIEEKLKKYSSNICLDGPKTLHLGHIKHLVTYFSSKLEIVNLPDLIEELHPTPAVCGLPLETSKQFILKEEGYDRDFYAGYIGIKTKEYQKYFVNLRCGKLYQNGALLFVGGGITTQSNPEKEWEETELKSKFIGECL